MKQHLYEKVIELLIERYHIYVDALINALSVDGRPILNVELTKEELVARWLDPVLRDTLIKRAYTLDGEEGVSNLAKKVQS